MNSEKKSWHEKLKTLWGLKSGWQLVWILITFALTGSTIVLIKKPIIDLLLGEGEKNLVFYILYYIFILPVYFFILFIYGHLLGQGHFFRWFIGKTLRRFKVKNHP